MPEGTITQMDKAAANQLSAATRIALEEVASRFGVDVQVGGGRYDPTAGTFMPKETCTESGGAEREWHQYAPLVGLDADAFGREFSSRGQQFRITGINLRASRFPVLAVQVGTGKTYKFPEAAIPFKDAS